MNREPNGRRSTWFTRPRPGTLGQTWQRLHRRDQASDAWLTGEGTAREAQASRWTAEPLPPLPQWPPLPGEDGLTAAGPSLDDMSGVLPTAPPVEKQPAPAWWDRPAPAPGQSDLPGRPRRTPWLRLRSASRRQRVGVAAVVAAILMLSVAVLGGGFRAGLPRIGGAVPAGTQANGGAGSRTTSLPTPTGSGVSGGATPAPATATPPPPFTITFTCASGAIGGTGVVCVHTQPGAILSLAVRYCDGGSAGGKSLQGAAHADGSGDYTWRWDVTTGCAGTATATVTAKSAGRIVTQSTTFTVTH